MNDPRPAVRFAIIAAALFASGVVLVLALCGVGVLSLFGR